MGSVKTSVKTFSASCSGVPQIMRSLKTSQLYFFCRWLVFLQSSPSSWVYDQFIQSPRTQGALYPACFVLQRFSAWFSLTSPLEIIFPEIVLLCFYLIIGYYYLFHGFFFLLISLTFCFFSWTSYWIFNFSNQDLTFLEILCSLMLFYNNVFLFHGWQRILDV